MVFQLGAFFARRNNLILLPHMDTKEKFLTRSEAVIAFLGMFGTCLCNRVVATSFQANKIPGVRGRLRP
jgi:predicted Rossmann-fold nucleotide-binding protein